MLLVASSILHADDTKSPDADRMERVSLAISPAAEPKPALERTLWLGDRQRKPGNGATNYYRALILSENARNAVAGKKDHPVEGENWLSVPLANFPKDDVALFLQPYHTTLAELEVATTRETCKWELRTDQLQGNDVLSLLLPEFQAMRDLGRVVAYKARYEIARGEYDDALQTLRMGYQMAHDAAEPPLLINALIGVSIAMQMHAVTLDLINTSGSPNVYWALKQLPQPLVDIRPALRFELTMPYQMFPFLKDAETARRSPEEWQRLTAETLANLNQLAINENSSRLADWQLRLGATALMMKAYPSAKQQLIDGGMDKAAVEKMPVAQVIALHASRSYRYTYEEMFKWTLLPYPEGRQPMQQTLARLKSEGYLGQPFGEKEVLPIATLLMPSVEAVMLATARLERRQAALETIEAIRMHAAARKGELPDSLEQLAVAPAPKNPFTGRLFDYRCDDRKAVIEERSPGLDPVRASDREYLIELIRTTK
jgi:hypothetical protein